MTRVLIIDDEESICWGLSKLCDQMGLPSDNAASAELGLELARAEQYDLIIMDVRLPGIDGLTAIKEFQDLLGEVPVITITAFGDLKTAIEAVRAGAFEYIVKPFELAVARHTIQQAIAAAAIRHAPASRAVGGQSHAEPPETQMGLVGRSPIMQELYKQIALTTTSDSPVLITGESGTGKELTARAIHQFSGQAKQPFVAVNIAALSPTLAESELFGHVKGAFTGADANRAGLIQRADGGTLFLDEIAEVPLDIQVKLLRVLDHGEVTPVGSNEPMRVRFRLISATHQNLLAQVNHGEFRHDLFYRLRTFEIQLPALRERKADIPELVDHFLAGWSTPISVSASFIDALKQQPWPGNVRQLQSVVARAAAIAPGGVLTADHVENTGDPAGANGPPFNAREMSSSELEFALKELVQQWTQHHWSRDTTAPLYEQLLNLIEPAILPTAFKLSDQQYSAAARRLGIHRTTLKKKLDSFEEPGSG